eukprot:366259-Chlamydomonas_euryale.AAC.16
MEPVEMQASMLEELRGCAVVSSVRVWRGVGNGRKCAPAVRGVGNGRKCAPAVRAGTSSTQRTEPEEAGMPEGGLDVRMCGGVSMEVWTCASTRPARFACALKRPCLYLHTAADLKPATATATATGTGTATDTATDTDTATSTSSPINWIKASDVPAVAAACVE